MSSQLLKHSKHSNPNTNKDNTCKNSEKIWIIDSDSNNIEIITINK